MTIRELISDDLYTKMMKIAIDSESIIEEDNSQQIPTSIIDNQCSISYHAQLRMKQRAGIKNLDTMIHFANNAKERGIYASSTNKYFEKEISKHTKNDDTYIVLYNGYYFVFTKDSNNLITIISADKNVSRKQENFNRKSNGNKLSTKNYFEQVEYAF